MMEVIYMEWPDKVKELRTKTNKDEVVKETQKRSLSYTIKYVFVER